MLLALGRLRLVILLLLDEVLQFLVAFVWSSAGCATDATCEASQLLEAVESLLLQDQELLSCTGVLKRVWHPRSIEMLFRFATIQQLLAFQALAIAADVAEAALVQILLQLRMRLLADVLVALEKDQLFVLPLCPLPPEPIDLLLQLPYLLFKLLVLRSNAGQLLHPRLEQEDFLVFGEELLLYLDQGLRLLANLLLQVHLLLGLHLDVLPQLANFAFLLLELPLELLQLGLVFGGVDGLATLACRLGVAATVVLLFGLILVTYAAILWPVLLFEVLEVALKLLDSVLHALDVQLELVLDSDVLSDICLQLLDDLLVDSGAGRSIVNGRSLLVLSGRRSPRLHRLE